MKLNPKIQKKVSKDYRVTGVLMLLIFSLIGLANFDGLFDMSSATASQHYGILGQPAPKLNLTGWINGQGKKNDPIKISDLRDRVIYLYFFQDW